MPLNRIFFWLGMLASASALVVSPTAHRLGPPRAARAPAATMGLLDWLGDFIYERSSMDEKEDRTGASTSAVSRLKVVLAHDRTGLDEFTMAKIRSEIHDVIAKYVQIDEDSIRFNLEQDDSMTLVTAVFPLVAGTNGRGAAMTTSGGPSVAFNEDGSMKA